MDAGCWFPELMVPFMAQQRMKKDYDNNNLIVTYLNRRWQMTRAKRAGRKITPELGDDLCYDLSCSQIGQRIARRNGSVFPFGLFHRSF